MRTWHSSEGEACIGYNWGLGESLSEELELISSKDGASPRGTEELNEECEELLSEEEHSRPQLGAAGTTIKCQGAARAGLTGCLE